MIFDRNKIKNKVKELFDGMSKYSQKVFIENNANGESIELFDIAYNNFELKTLNCIKNIRFLKRKITSNYSPEEYINHIEPLGIYWSISNPYPHWGGFRNKYIYEFKIEVNKKDIDIESTMLARSYGSMGLKEDEITLKSGSKVKLIDINVECINKEYQKINKNKYINKFYAI